MNEVRYITGTWSNRFELCTKTWLFLGILGLAMGASWICYVRVLQAGDLSKVAPVDKLSLLLVAIFAGMFLHERPTMQAWVGILLVGAGVLILGRK